MGKIKTEPEDVPRSEDDVYAEKLKYVNAISQPMSSRKMTKKVYKLIKKAKEYKSCLRNGLKDVQTRLRKGETGIIIFAGDVTPVEIMCHLPAVCEEKGLPYTYTPSRADLGAAMGVKRGTVALMVREHPEYKELYNDVLEDMKSLQYPSDSF